MTASASTAGEQDAPIGRRERKRLETRASLVTASLELFAEEGFDEVTVTEIAERADVDPSTFFRHFGSKEVVLFTDVLDFVALVRPTLLGRPADEPLMDALSATAHELLERSPFDAKQELLRARLPQASPSLRAQVPVYREMLVQEFTVAIAERLGVDQGKDPRPLLIASAWVAASDFYRRQVIMSGKRPKNARAAAAAILTIFRNGIADLE